MTHIDESAELYALGMLDDAESASVLAHAKTCAECARSLARAEQVVAALSEGILETSVRPQLRDRLLASAAGPSKARVRYRWFGGGLAAGLAVAALVLLSFHFTGWSTPTSDDLALSTIVQSHFYHVSFVALHPGAPKAKVLYAKHLEWIYVIIHEPPRGMEVVAAETSGTRTLGRLDVAGENGTLFLRAPGRIKQILLLENGVAVARATPVSGP
jgi:hypothetical protein